MTEPTPEARLSRATSKAGRLQRALWGLLLEHQNDDALPTSARFLFYELEQRALIPKAYRYADGSKRAREPSQDVSDALTHLREAGIVPWSAIVDEMRTVESWTYADTVTDYLRSSASQARIDVWAGEPPPLIVTESRSLRGVLRRVASDYLCPITALGGQSSGSLLWDIADLFTHDRGKRLVLYLGDFDLSGGHIEDSARNRLERFLGHVAEWERLALTAEQVRIYGLPPITKIDHRFRPVRPYEAVETEALSQSLLVGMLRDRLDALLPEPLADVRLREEGERHDAVTQLGGDGG